MIVFLLRKMFINDHDWSEMVTIPGRNTADHFGNVSGEEMGGMVAMTAEQPEAKQKTKEKKKTTAVAEDKTAVVAEQGVSADDAVPVEATKEEATVQIWPGLATVTVPHQSARLGYGWATAGLRLGYGWATAGRHL